MTVNPRKQTREGKPKGYIPLLWRVFALNAAVLAAAVALTAVVLPPRFAPPAEDEAAILVASLALMLVINLLLLRHSFAPSGASPR